LIGSPTTMFMDLRSKDTLLSLKCGKISMI